MKNILLPFILINSLVYGQDSTRYKFKLKEHIVPASLIFVAGMADGMRDAVLFRNDVVLSKLNVNKKWWGPESWRNKYKDGDPAKGRKFPGSKTWLVWTTDANHFFKLTNNLFTSGAITIKLTHQKRKWYIYVLEGAGYWAINRLGFAAIYYRF